MRSLKGVDGAVAKDLVGLSIQQDIQRRQQNYALEMAKQNARASIALKKLEKASDKLKERKEAVESQQELMNQIALASSGADHQDSWKDLYSHLSADRTKRWGYGSFAEKK